MPSDEPNSMQQACAIPYRHRKGKLELCLITSSNNRWLFPKGIVEPGDTLEETALKEAHEEAGLRGRIRGKPVGRYELSKSGVTIPVTVMVMEVKHSEADWAESATRERRWVTPEEAQQMVSHRKLRDLLTVVLKRLDSK